MFKCKNCGSDMRFDPATQKLVCRYCGTSVSAHDYAEDQAIQADEQTTREESSSADPDTSDSSNTFQVNVMTCPQCGAELLTTDETAATFCSFCGSSVLLQSRISRERRPDYIIPFKISREDCEKSYRKMLKRSPYIPSDMLKEEQIEHFRGIYMPYWVYAFEKHGPISRRGKISHRRGDYIISKNYKLESHVDASYDGLAFDASSTFSDHLSEAIAPFQFSEAESFEPAYLSGFYADTSDVSASTYQGDATRIATEHAVDELSHAYAWHKYNIDRSSLDNGLSLDLKPPKLAMYPVWFLACRNKAGDRVSYAAVNGQTGEIAADLPVDKKKLLLGTLILAIPLFFLLNLGLTLTPGAALGVTIFLGFIGIMLADNQIHQIYRAEHLFDDKGYMSIHDPWGKKKHKNRPWFAPESSGCPASEQFKVLWKPIVGIVIAMLVILLKPVSDLYYYTAAVIAMIFVAWSFWDTLKLHNRLATRPLPQFNKRGGEEYENS